MLTRLQLRGWVTLFLGLTVGAVTQAQQLYVGPTAWYLVSTSAPETSATEGQPTRLLVGGSALWLLQNKTEVRVTLGYRYEQGTFGTPESLLPNDGNTSNTGPSRLHVVETGQGEPLLTSTLTASSVELNAGLGFPLLALDTSGSNLGLSVGVMTDVILSASQEDDYSAIPNHPDPDLVTASYEQQFGFGAYIGAFLGMNLGGSRISFDVTYMFRQPGTLSTTGTPVTEQNIGWLIGRGLRIGIGLFFGL